VNGPVRVAASLFWLPVILLSTYLSDPPPERTGPAAVAAVLGGLAWVVVAVRPARPRWLDPTAIVVLSASGIVFMAAGGGWSSVLGFCFFAVVAAGTRLPATAAVGVLVGTIVGVALVLRAAHPLALAFALLGLAGVLLLGMGRRESLRRTEQQELRLVNAARLQEEHARAAALAERTRIARDVHDVLAHSLSALALQLEGTRLLARDRDADPEVVEGLERAHHLAVSGLSEARQAIAALRGDELPAIEDLARGFPNANVTVTGTPREPSSEARLALYRTAQEALTNVRRHSASDRIELRLDYANDGTTLTVQDHGPAAPLLNGAPGYGLTGMRERAELLGGRLQAGPTDDGFKVELWLPG
jgi:signal transduction histidine kinase